MITCQESPTDHYNCHIKIYLSLGNHRTRLLLVARDATDITSNAITRSTDVFPFTKRIIVSPMLSRMMATATSKIVLTIYYLQIFFKFFNNFSACNFNIFVFYIYPVDKERIVNNINGKSTGSKSD